MGCVDDPVIGAEKKEGACALQTAEPIPPGWARAEYGQDLGSHGALEVCFLVSLRINGHDDCSEAMLLVCGLVIS